LGRPESKASGLVWGAFFWRYNRTQLFSSPESAGLSHLPESPNGPLVSEPERALLEMLSEVGLSQELNEARAIMEGMRQIPVKRLLQWIQCCKMVKAVRLCAFWSWELELQPFEHICPAEPEKMAEVIIDSEEKPEVDCLTSRPAAPALVREHYDWEAITRMYLKTVKRLLTRQKK
jgi:hypothetical protein|tara:strand:- start:2978 stop:3505 length:528 start_codon:yes stop_codon:yes gene_type:complete